MALNKIWRNLPTDLAPLPQEFPAEWFARIAAYDLANPGVLTPMDAAAMMDVETRAQAELNAKVSLVGGLVPTSQIPAVATGQTVTVANQAGMLALTTAQVQSGDVAIRSDQAGRRWILAAADPSLLGSWIALEVPDAVSSVNSQQGAVVLGKANVGLGSVDNTADTAKPVSTAQQSALDAKAVTTDTRFPAGADIVNADIAAAAAIAESKLALASDAAAATASRRTLGTGAAQALPGNQGLLVPAQAVGATRVFGATYQPSTTRPVLVVATFNLTVPGVSRAMVYARCDSITPAATIVAREALYVYGPDQVIAYRSITFLVPAGHYYLLESAVVLGTPTIAIDRVMEQAL